MIHCTLGNVQKPVSASFWEQSPWMKSPTILASSSYYGLIPSINLKSFSETKTWSFKPDSGCSYKPGYSCVLYLETMRKRVRCQKGCRRGNVNVNVNWNHVKHNCCEVNSATTSDETVYLSLRTLRRNARHPQDREVWTVSVTLDTGDNFLGLNSAKARINCNQSLTDSTLVWTRTFEAITWNEIGEEHV